MAEGGCTTVALPGRELTDVVLLTGDQPPNSDMGGGALSMKDVEVREMMGEVQKMTEAHVRELVHKLGSISREWRRIFGRSSSMSRRGG